MMGKRKWGSPFHTCLKPLLGREVPSTLIRLLIFINASIVPKKQDDTRNPAAPPPLHRVGTPWTDFENTTPSSSPLIPSTNEIPSVSENTNIPQTTNPSVSVSITQSPIWSHSSNNGTIVSQLSVGSELLPAVASGDTHTEPVGVSPPHVDENTQPIVEKKPTKEP